VSGRVVLIDGVVVAPENAVVSVYDRGFLYGDAVFEVLRTYGSVPFAIGEHIGRLRQSAERVFIDVPLDDAAWRAEIRRAIDAAGNDDSYVRIVLTRGTGPLSLDPATAGRPLRVVFVEPVVPPPRESYDRGVAAILVRTRRAVDQTSAEGAKVGNYLSNLLALRQAKARGAHEALVVDGRGFVIEGASSNVFLVKDGRLSTPPESSGILAGITRAYVLAAADHLGNPVDLRDVSIADPFDADEAFITSSIRELMPIVRVDDRAIGSGLPGPVTRALHERFRVVAGS
jgi:branched-chain amino acid aminotransferase